MGLVDSRSRSGAVRALVLIASVALAGAAGCGKEDCEVVGVDGEGKPIKKCGAGGKAEAARQQLTKIVEAYAGWRARSPERCPASLAALGVSEQDPWGRPYKWYCGESVPAGAGAFAARSLGPDGKEDTADDLKSW